jgi:hypothetical protein
MWAFFSNPEDSMLYILRTTAPVELERDIKDPDLGDIKEEDDTRFWKKPKKGGKKR